MTAPHRTSIVIFGIAIFFLGFLYDARFSGLPYQDPTPAMQADWLFHGMIAAWIMRTGAAIALVGVLWAGLARLKGRR
ncbi:MAG: hypothetical protein JXQ79_05600 [Rhodobacteraceae bacterium]|nr:hypothetical protein [Paracoccaceae bacterium]